MGTATGTLYCVATPIGNLSDITVRALDILGSVQLILAEDTRVTHKLLTHYSIHTPLQSYHQHSSSHQVNSFVAQLQAGKTMAIVTDAGTPGISDPGSVLIQQAIAAGIKVVPIPGASAVITALQAAGVDTSSFMYLGFLPHKKGRQTIFKYIVEADHTVVCYESPHRILKTLEALRDCPKQIVLARELTKMYEEFLRGTASELFKTLSERDAIKGEFVVVVNRV